MTEADESKVTRPTAEAGAETLSARIRREGDLSSRAGQLDRLYALADEADTLRAQLEAAELRDAQMRDAAKLLLARAEAAEAALVPCKLRKVAKRNLRSLIDRGSDDRELMLKCLEELS